MDFSAQKLKLYVKKCQRLLLRANVILETVGVEGVYLIGKILWT